MFKTIVKWNVVSPPARPFDLTLFFLFRPLDSDSSSSSTADEAQSPASLFHSSPLSPSFLLDPTPALSPSHPAFLLPSPASSSSSSSSSSSFPYSLHCGMVEPNSPTGSSSSRGSMGGGAVMSETGSFSAQVGIFTSASKVFVCQQNNSKTMDVWSWNLCSMYSG